MSELRIERRPYPVDGWQVLSPSGVLLAVADTKAEAESSAASIATEQPSILHTELATDYGGD